MESLVDLEQYENMFNNAAGMVYYFTTGDNSQVNEEIETEGSDGNRVTKYTETAANRAHNAAIAALERSTELDVKDADQKTKMYEMLGRFGIAVIKGE